MIQQPVVIPRPAHCELLRGTFELTAETTVHTDNANEWNGSYLQELLAAAVGAPPLDAATETSIRLSIGGDVALLGQEGYELVVSETAVSITAPSSTGVSSPDGRC